MNVSKPYDILLGGGLFNRVNEVISPFCRGRNIAIVTDDIVNEIYGEKLLNQLRQHGYSAIKYVFPNGEASKNINTLSGILEFLAERDFKRNDFLIALGGGVVGDITGFAASVYMRGIGFIQIPTTLLAMVDASIGGKTAIDLSAGKNLAGAFWQPSLVICDTNIIKALPDEIFREGMGEVLKYGVIDNMGIFQYVFDNHVNEKLDLIILDCIRSKQRVVQEDEFETKGVRKVLNVGHTFAHGLEKLSDYAISHGVAVGTGLAWEAGISYKLGMCSFETFQSIKKAVKKWNLLVNFDFGFEDLVLAMKKDKKNDDSLISFMLPIQLGNCVEKKIDGVNLISTLENVGRII